MLVVVHQDHDAGDERLATPARLADSRSPRTDTDPASGWRDDGLLPFEQFCDLTRTPSRTVRDLATTRRPTGSSSKNADGSTSPSPKYAASSPPNGRRSSHSHDY